MTYNHNTPDYEASQRARLQDELDAIKAGQIVAAYAFVIVMGFCLGAGLFWALSN